MSVSSVQRTHYTPTTQVCRAGCPCVMTPTLQTSTRSNNGNTALKEEKTTMFLEHKTKEGHVKNRLSLATIHTELERAALYVNGTGASNTLLATVSFDCKITDNTKRIFRKYVYFDLKIPGTNSEQDGAVFSYDFLKKMYGSQKRVYRIIEAFYNTGCDEVNPNHAKHGHRPDYGANTSKHDQYIRHTEQFLVAYLASQEASQMLLNRLRTLIRSDYPGATSAKVYNIGLHLHSTKTCCAPCEYSLIGLMTPNVQFSYRSRELGLLSNLQRLGAMLNEQLQFSFPKKSCFRMLVTVTAGEKNAEHREQPLYTCKELKNNQPAKPYSISVKDPQVSRTIYTAMLESGDDRRKRELPSHLHDKTVGISGSLASPGSRGTIDALKGARDEELCREFNNLLLG